MKILFISLGCDKNLVDSEVMLGLLTKHGYTLTDDETQADVIVINTCCQRRKYQYDLRDGTVQRTESEGIGCCWMPRRTL